MTRSRDEKVMEDTRIYTVPFVTVTVLLSQNN